MGRIGSIVIPALGILLGIVAWLMTHDVDPVSRAVIVAGVLLLGLFGLVLLIPVIEKWRGPR